MTAPDSVGGFPVTQVAGYLAHTVARSTGTLVFLADTEAFGLSVEDGGKYLLVCDPHSTILQHTNKGLALEFMRHPEEWCETCMESSARG